MGLDFGLMSILYMYVYIDCGPLCSYAKNVYDSNFKQTCLPHRFNHTSPFSVGVKPHFINIPPPNYARGIVNQDSKEYIKPLVFIH